MTQRELAKKVGLAPSIIAKIELGERRVDVVEYVLIARALGCNEGTFFEKISKAIP